ncbi:unnamed protein product, partial [Hapterophycus canaliculatus]
GERVGGQNPHLVRGRPSNHIGGRHAIERWQRDVGVPTKSSLLQQPLGGPLSHVDTRGKIVCVNRIEGRGNCAGCRLCDFVRQSVNCQDTERGKDGGGWKVVWYNRNFNAYFTECSARGRLYEEISGLMLGCVGCVGMKPRYLPRGTLSCK